MLNAMDHSCPPDSSDRGHTRTESLHSTKGRRQGTDIGEGRGPGAPAAGVGVTVGRGPAQLTTANPSSRL